MSFLGGIMKSLVNPMSLMQLAMGPAGWASLAMKTIGSAVAQQVIQKLGQELGLPQGLIGLAQNAFSAASGTQGMPKNVRDAVGFIASQANLSPSQQGQLTREMNNGVDSILKNVMDNMINGQSDTSGMRGNKGKQKAGGSWLERIAAVMG